MIVYFSGTGNSRAVALALGESLGERVEFVNDCLDLSTHSRIIWVSPIHAWGLPGIVVDAIEKASFNPSSKHFLVATHGDDLGLAHKLWRRLIEQKEADPVATFSVIMPNTYISLPFFDVDSPEVVNRKLSQIPARINEIAAAVDSGKNVDDVITGSMPWLKTSIIYPSFIRHASSAKSFSVDDQCVKCGRCERICPTANISRPSGSPQWHDNCTGCLACYHACPVHAIARGRFSAHKGQYLHPLLKAEIAQR